MSCPNCNCRECAKDRAKPDGWTWVSQMYGYVKHGPDLRVWNTYDPPKSGFWHWSIGDFAIKGGPYASKEAAQQAAEAATLPAGSTPDPTK